MGAANFALVLVSDWVIPWSDERMAASGLEYS